METPILFKRGSTNREHGLEGSTWMPSSNGSFVDKQLNVNESGGFDTRFHHGRNFVKAGYTESIPNLSRGEEDIGPSRTRCIGRDRVVVTTERWADFGELDPTISTSRDDALHLPDERPPILDPSSKEASIHNIETGFGILETKVDIIDLWSVATEMGYLKGQVVGLVRQHDRRQVDTNELGPRKNLGDFLDPDTASTSYIQDTRWIVDGNANTALPELTHSPMHRVQTLHLDVAYVRLRLGMHTRWGESNCYVRTRGTRY
jgi:hypothetical protein